RSAGREARARDLPRERGGQMGEVEQRLVELCRQVRGVLRVLADDAGRTSDDGKTLARAGRRGYDGRTRKRRRPWAVAVGVAVRRCLSRILDRAARVVARKHLDLEIFS